MAGYGKVDFFMINVVVLGGTGMLGSMVVDVLARNNNIKVTATSRSSDLINRFSKRAPEVNWDLLDVYSLDRNEIASVLAQADWVINAIGMTKPYAHDDNPMEVERAILVNALLPFELSHVAGDRSTRIIQIATDCVYDGIKGGYIESDPHNALDVYGKTKSLGEALLSNVNCLRCSIIGPEPKAYVSLLEWFRRQLKSASVNGFTNHLWNGVTTLHFALVCQGVILQSIDLPHLQHVIPDDAITKSDLLKGFAQDFHREDISIQPVAAKTIIDRTLATTNKDLNQKLWDSAGYSVPPSVLKMVSELASFDYRFEGV